jgi:uncharacterized secreted repeat protein (TIGR03808 family)
MPPVCLDRRATLAAAVLAGAATPSRAAAGPDPAAPVGGLVSASAFGLDPGATRDQSVALQTAIDQTAAKGLGLCLAPGRYLVGGVVLRPGTHLVGATRASTLVYDGRGACLTARDASGVHLERLTLDGAGRALDHRLGDGLVTVSGGRNLVICDVAISNTARHALVLTGSGGRIERCTLTGARGAGLFSRDATGLEIAHNTISDCGDNGVLVWRGTHGDDGTRIHANTITRIAATSGGSGQNGNGINLFRAGAVQVSGNRMTDCAYSAVRANEASHIQITANQVARIGEVALYVEAAGETAGAPGFEGAIVSNNLVDRAAAGIVVTNFNNGGRLAVVSGNFVRHLFRREYEPRDKRGEGISVEADAVVTSNVVEAAETAGIVVGWGRHLRDCVVTGNLVRRSPIGIAVSGIAGAGSCLIANNMIAGARDGAIRLMDHLQPLPGDLARGATSPSHISATGNVVSGTG